MKKQLVLSAVAVCLGLVLFAAVFVVGDEMPQGFTGLCAGLGGALIGLGGSNLFLPLLMRTLSPEQQKEIVRGEQDERNVAIRNRAALDSWYWTLALLWVPFVAAMVRGELFWMAMCPAVLVLHCAFYLFHMYRWSRRM